MLKKILLMACLVLIFQFASAKEVTVIFNFPEGTFDDVIETISLEDDANAFTAFTTVAYLHSIDLNMTYYGEEYGFFVNGINGINNSNTEFWLFWVNYIALAPVGISFYVPEDKEIIELAYSDWPTDTELTVTAVNSSNEGLKDVEIYLNGVFLGKTDSDGKLQNFYTLKKDFYEIKAVLNSIEKTKIVEVVDYSPISIEFVFGEEDDVINEAIEWLLNNQKENGEFGEHAVWGNAFALMALSLTYGNETAIENGLNYLLSNQGDDAGFGYPGFGSDALHTAVSIMAFLSNGKKLEEFDINGVTSIDFILTKQENDGGFSGWGQSDVDTTAWAVMALVQAAQSMPEIDGNNPIDFLYSVQNSDGGFPYQKGEESKVDFTAESLIALSAAEEPKNNAVENALNFLKEKQLENGCFENSYLTALAVIAFLGFDENVNTAVECLKTLQLSDGGFGRDNENSNSVDTALAIIALKEKTLPLNIVEQDENYSIPINTGVKFVVPIKNVGRVSAFNVLIEMNGFPAEWVDEEASTTFFSEIKPNETNKGIIYATFKEEGKYSVFATVDSDQSTPVNTNVLELTVEGTTLQVSIYIE